MHNRVVLLRSRSFQLVWFGVFAGLGMAAGAAFALARAEQAGLPLGAFALTLVVSAFTSIVGSRLLALALDWRLLRQEPAEALLKTGFAFQGGLALTTLGLVVSCRALELPTLLVMDVYAMTLPLAHAIGRLGCHSYGCCHGRPTRGRLAIVVRNPDSKTAWDSGLLGVPLHPTALYEAGLTLVIFGLLAAVAAYTPAAGLVTALYFLLEPAKRLGIERLRGERADRLGALSSYQVIALLLLGVSLLVGAAIDPGRALDLGAVSLGGALADLAGWWPLGLALFLIGLLSFGVQGPRLGRFSVARAGEEPRAPAEAERT